MAYLDRHMPDTRINADGTLPMYRDPETGESKPTLTAEAVLEGTGGNGPHTHDDYAATAHAHSHDHDGSYASPHTHPYSADDHNHPDGGHDHDGTYEPVHAHPYSGTGHNHDAAYSGLAHAHAAHDHDGTYSATAHDHAGVYEPTHQHPYAADDHIHQAGDHPDLATHEGLGLVTDTDLTAHAATVHGTQAHAIDGASHTGSLTAAEVGAATVDHSHDYAASAHTHAGGDGVPAGIIAMWSGVVSAIPTGWALCNGQNGTPDLRDRFIVGAASGADPGATGGASTHTHTAHSGVIDHTHTVSVTDPGHVHVENSNNATTGGLRGWGAPDTSTNTSQATGYSTASATTGITAATANPAGSVASLTHDSPSHLPPFYALAFIQKL